MVLGFNGHHDLDALAALDLAAIFQGKAIVDHALEQRRSGHELVVVAPNEDLISRGRDRLFETEELALGCEIDRARSVLAHDANLISAIANDLAIDLITAGRAERIAGAELLACD